MNEALPLSADLAVRARFGQLHHSPAEGCWEWKRMDRRDKRPRFKVGDRIVVAARVAYALHVAPVPEGADVLHKCDNKRCVRPDHLYLGTQLDNSRDARERGLTVRGSDCWNAKIESDEQARSIRERAAAGESIVDLQRSLGISRFTLAKLIKGETWKYAGGPIRAPLTREEVRARYRRRVESGRPVGRAASHSP